MKKVSIIVPCYNEKNNIKLFYNEVIKAFKKQKYECEIIFIDDGSKDGTLLELKKVSLKKECIVKILSFSRNFGKEAAMYAGLVESNGDFVSIIDADMQQNPKLIIDMLKFLDNNDEYDSVAFKQNNRKEGFILRFLKYKFYQLINKLSEIEFVLGASDFRLFKRNMVNAIISMNENNRFSKGIFAWVGFKTYYMPYQAEKRNSGNSTWSFWKLFNYAVSGIVSFSTTPIKIATIIGFFVSLISFFYLVIVLFQKIFLSIDVPGYATIVILILLLGGVQLLCLGILGEYLGKTYIQTKQRPIYIIKEKFNNEKNNN